MADGSYHKSTYTFPPAIPPKRLRYKGRIRGIMRNFNGLNRPEGGLDGHSSACLEEGDVGKIPSNQALNATAPRSQASLTHPRCRRPCVLPACGAVIARADACGRLGPRGCTTHRRMAMTARRRRLREDLPRRGVAPTPPPGSREAVTHLAPYDQRAPAQRRAAEIRP